MTLAVKKASRTKKPLKGFSHGRRGRGVAADTLVIGVTESKSMDPSRGPWHRLDLAVTLTNFAIDMAATTHGIWPIYGGYGSNPQQTTPTCPDMLNPGSLVGLPTGTALGGSAIEHHQQRLGNLGRALEDVLDRLI